MLTDHDLQALLKYQAKSPVLSVYLDTDPADGNAETHRLHLRSMLKDVDLEGDVAAVLAYFDHEHDWTGRSVSIFSSEPEGFFESYRLAVPIRSRIHVGEKPYVKPLADLFDSYGGYGVVLVDKQGARLFSFHLGELKEQEGLLGESVRRTKRGGGSQATGRRGGTAGQTNYVDEVTERNIKEAVEFSTQFFTDHDVRRILIGGSEDNIAAFRNQLPKAWQSLVVGTFPISMNASHGEVLEKSMQIGLEAEKNRELHLVNTILTNAGKGRGGVVGLDDTLAAIREGRVQILVIRDGTRSPGTRCLSCGYISAVELEYCPFCGGECVTIPDVIETAVHNVLEAGGDVEVIQASQDAGNFKEIGALLRY